MYFTARPMKSLPNRKRRPTEKGRAFIVSQAPAVVDNVPVTVHSSSSEDEDGSSSDDGNVRLIDLAKKSLAATAAAAASASKPIITPAAAAASSNVGSFYGSDAAPVRARPAQTPTAQYREKVTDTLAKELTIDLAAAIERQMFTAVLICALSAAAAAVCSVSTAAVAAPRTCAAVISPAAPAFRFELECCSALCV